MQPTLARLADALTTLRLVLAFAVVPLTSTGRWTALSVALSGAWLSDFLDGRLARRAGGGTRLGRWDMPIDTAVGAGLVIGLVLRGTLPEVVGVGALALFGTLYLFGNVAASMLLQLTGFLPTLVILWEESPTAWWLPFGVIVLVGIFDWRRLLHVNIPAFLRGITGRFESR